MKNFYQFLSSWIKNVTMSNLFIGNSPTKPNIAFTSSQDLEEKITIEDDNEYVHVPRNLPLGDISIEIEQMGLSISQSIAEGAITLQGCSNEESKWIKIKTKVKDNSTITNYAFWRNKILTGISDDLRSQMWCHLTQSKEIQKLRGENYYRTLLEAKRTDIEKYIEEDLARTFSEIPLFKEPSASGKNKLFNLLKAYSIHDKDVSYCQGMNYVAAMLLLFIKDEELAFYTFYQIMTTYDWRRIYTQGMPKLMELLEELTNLIKTQVPVVFSYFQQNQIDLAGLFSHIFVTAFIYRMPFSFAVILFDLFLLEKEQGILTSIVNMLRLMQDTVIKCDPFEIHDYIKTKLASDCFSNYKFADIAKELDK